MYVSFLHSKICKNLIYILRDKHIWWNYQEKWKDNNNKIQESSYLLLRGKRVGSGKSTQGTSEKNVLFLSLVVGIHVIFVGAVLWLPTGWSTEITGITWDFLRNAEAGPTPDCLNRNLHFKKIPSDFFAHWSLRTTTLKFTCILKYPFVWINVNKNTSKYWFMFDITFQLSMSRSSNTQFLFLIITPINFSMKN